jgi:hypothetical protein
MRNKIVTALIASSLLASALLAVPAQVLAVDPVTHWVALGAALDAGPGTSCAAPGYRSNNQDALEDALDDVSAGDTVHICAGEYVYTADFNAPGALPDNVTIEGAGAGSTILNGADQYYLLAVENADGIVVQNLGFEHGQDTYGAGLYVDDSEVDVLNCSFSNNEATTGAGAGLYAEDSDVNVFDSSFSSNEAPSDGGAGLYAYGSTVNVFDSSFSNNAALFGGALVAEDSTVVIERSTFTENVATNDDNDYGGAAAYTYNGEITIINSRFVRNESAGVGGAVELYDGPVTISGSTFIGNKAQQGPAIDVYGDDSPLVVTGSSFINNVNTTDNNVDSEYDDGAAISSERNDSDLTLTGNIFRGNRGAEYGGAVETWRVTGEIIITNNRFERNMADEGGALWIDVRGGTQDIRGNTFRGNRAKKGGAIAFECEVSPARTVSRLLARQNRFSGNSASRSARSANVFASDYDSSEFGDCAFD